MKKLKDGYDSPFGITTICPGRYRNLQISWDYDTNPDDKKHRTAVLLFTPNLRKFNHEHIVLNRKQALVLRNWLDRFLTDI